jgi:hypothetical protein
VKYYYLCLRVAGTTGLHHHAQPFTNGFESKIRDDSCAIYRTADSWFLASP